MAVLPTQQISSLLSPRQILSRLHKIVHDLPMLNDANQVRALSDHAESIRYFTKKLRYDQDIQNAAAEAALWTKRRLGELLPYPQLRGGDRRAISTMDIDSMSGAARALGIPQAQASRCAELARIPRNELEKYVSEVKEAEGELSTAAVFRHLTALRRGSRSPDMKRRTPRLPDGVFEVIYADPPWEYEFGVSSQKAIERHYPTMTREQVCALPVAAITAPDAMLFLWATSPKLQSALHVMEAWGFSYRSSMVWVKDGMGLGFYARINHEFLLIGRKGAYPAPEAASRPSSVLTERKGRHSEKPACVYDLLERMYPDARKVELFARQARSGWTLWGNEVCNPAVVPVCGTPR